MGSSLIIFLGLRAATSPKIFYGVQVRWLWRPLENLSSPLLKPSHGGLWGRLNMIFLLEGSMKPKLSFLTEGIMFFLEFPDTWLSPSCHSHLQVSNARGSKAAPDHPQTPTILHCRQGVFFSICFILPPLYIPLIHRPKQFQIYFIAP